MFGQKEIIAFTLQKLKELKLKAEFEDRARKKKRYVSKTSAYQDLINLLESIEIEQAIEKPKRKVGIKNKRRIQCVETGIIYNGIKEAEDDLHTSHLHISECCNGLRASSGGYSWRYIDESN